MNQFTEIWAVPPSSATLKVRDVRIASGTIVGPPPVTTQIPISDVAGLATELSARPLKGSGFAAGRAAVINSVGQIDAAAGNSTDCIRVDGSSGVCGGSGGGVVPGIYRWSDTIGNSERDECCFYAAVGSIANR